jgi:hypothetical protein
MIPPFEKFRKNPFSGRLITFDPGETTGYSIWDDGKLIEASQLNTHDVKSTVLCLNEWLKKTMPPICYCVIEEYRVYQHKTESHAQNDMHTSRLIGCLETLLTLKGVGYQMRGAGLAKKFADDVKLEAWGFWKVGEKHARDAIRHGIYYYCTPPKK